MNIPPYIIGSGYWHAKDGDSFRAAAEFHALWWKQIMALNPAPEHTFVVCVADCVPPWLSHGISHIPLRGNLGHVGQLLNGEKPYSLCGWSASVLTLALLAYQNETDFVFVEQDCLAFGPWLQRIYNELGDGQMIFGRRHEASPWMPASQSLFLIKHAFLPRFIEEYLKLGTDANHENLPETKFVRIEEMFQEKIKRFSFGYDREKPIRYEDEVFYAQQLEPYEMQELKKRGLI